MRDDNRYCICMPLCRYPQRGQTARTQKRKAFSSNNARHLPTFRIINLQKQIEILSISTKLKVMSCQWRQPAVDGCVFRNFNQMIKPNFGIFFSFTLLGTAIRSAMFTLRWLPSVRSACAADGHKRCVRPRPAVGLTMTSARFTALRRSAAARATQSPSGRHAACAAS